MNIEHILEGMFVSILFLEYVLLWRMKQRRQQAETGHDPEVIYQDSRPSQTYFASVSRVMTILLILLVVLHTLGVTAIPGFYRITVIDTRGWDIVGLILGQMGLLLCFLAQRTMGNAWRVGIDPGSSEALVTTGVFALIRNPTYSGLFLVCIGAWLIFPTMSLLMWCVVFMIMLEFQVRQEEEFLSSKYGEAYVAYYAKTTRYIPYLY